MDKQKNKGNEEHWMLLVLLLKEVCDQRGITQGQLAEITGFKQSHISRLFSLKYAPSMKTFMTVAHALKLNVYFQTREDKDDLNQAFEKAMEELGRRPDKLSKN